MEVGPRVRLAVRATLDRAALPLATAGLGAAAWQAWRLYRAATASPQRAEPPAAPLALSDDLPLVSVLVAAWNEANHLDALVDSFEQVSYPHRELVICAGGTDGTFELASRRAGARVRVLHQEPGLGKQRALQRCYGVAQGSILMLTDADCRLLDDGFSRLLAPIVQGEAAAVTGVAEPAPELRRAGLVRYQWLIDRWWHGQLPPEGDGLHGRNCALTRAALEQVGGFRAEVRTGTDYHLAQSLRQAGYSIRVVRTSRVISDYPTEPSAYLRMYERWHKNLLILGPRFGAWSDVRRVLVAFGLYGAMLVLPLATPLIGRIALAGSGTLLGAAMLQRLARAGAGARLAGVDISPELVLRTAQATALDIAAVFLAIYATLDPQRRVRW
jgi:GT2 family glycosyltransferase